MKIGMTLCSKILAATILLTTAILAVSCAEEDIFGPVTGGNNIRFSLTEDTGWGAASAGETRSSESHGGSGVLTLNGGNDADTLYIHTRVSDGIESGSTVQSEGGTRAAPVTDLSAHGAFGVLGYLYSGTWDGTQTPNFMYNIEIKKQGAVWGPSSTYYWPGGSGKKMRFFAYAPYNGAGISLSGPSTLNTPYLTYVVPDNVADQKDILVAKSAELAADYNNNAALSFTHPLTAVKFVVGDDMVSSRVTKITLKNILSGARYIIGESSWTPIGQYKDFSQTLDVSPGTTPGTAITSPAQTFMMIPQTLPALAKIEIELTDLLSNQNWTLSASIAQGVWPIGKTVTYKISTSSIDVQYAFEVSPSVTFGYEGGTDNGFSVTTSRTVSGPGHPGNPEHVPASITGYSTDGGATWEPWPSGGLPWLTIADFQNVPTSQVYDMTADPLPAVYNSPQNTALKNAAPVTNYDLSTFNGILSRNTANCYVVNAPGTYSLPLVYGNAVKNGQINLSAYMAPSGTHMLTNFINHDGQPIVSPYLPAADGATLVWQDADGLVTDVALDGSNNLTFTVNQATIRQGNAIVAALSGSDILWSWHIWVTNYQLGADDKYVTNYTNKAYSLMPVNIGWCDPFVEVYTTRTVKIKVKQQDSGTEKICTITQNGESFSYSGNNPYFQWGRKDPMLPGVIVDGNSQTDKPFYTTNSAYAFNIVAGYGTLPQSISHPYNLYTFRYEYDWCSPSYDNLWNNNASDSDPSMNDIAVVKTIYDPSPVGYALPPSNIFTGVTYSGDNASQFVNINTPYTSVGEIAANSGWIFYCNKMLGPGSHNPNGGTYFMPNSGGREEGVLFDVNLRGHYWTGGVCYEDKDEAVRLFIDNTHILDPSDYQGRSYAFPVRPMRQL